MPYLIDGHNLVYAIRGSSEEFQSVNEEVMCAVLNEYFYRVKDSAFVVFDGTGPIDKSYFHNLSHMKVQFAGEGIEADDVIEDEIEDSTSPRRLVVVSSDRKIRLSASKRRCTSLSSQDFWAMVVKRLDKPAPKNIEPKEKYQGVTDSEADVWLKLFGLK